MASDGNTFRLYIPSKKPFHHRKSQRLGSTSKTGLENLRPRTFWKLCCSKGRSRGKRQAVLEVHSDGSNSYYIIHIGVLFGASAASGAGTSGLSAAGWSGQAADF